VGAVLGTLVTAQGCISNGDASLGNDGTTAGSGGSAGDNAKAGSTATPTGGKSSAGGATTGSGGKTVVPSTGEGGATLVGTGGETGEGGHQAVGACELPIEVGPCDAAIPRFAFDAATGKCEPFSYGGCEGNANNFMQQADCQRWCEAQSCPDHLQTDTVYKVYALNRPERACFNLEEPIVVSCSMLLDPSLTVPSDYGQNFCVKRDDQLYRAGTTLPKADGWEDCSAPEAEIVADAPDCRDL
jgi:hypothetical protein